MTQPSAPLPLTTVFVYGTLMPGERNAHVAAQGGTFSARPARLSGYRLFHLHPENYPGLTPGSRTDSVQGYALTYSPADWARALPFLDALEGLDETPPLYTREQVTLTSSDGDAELFPAWVYVYARPVRLAQGGVQFIPSGDWREAENRAQHGPDER